MKPAEIQTKLSKHDREIDAIRKLIRTGMRLIVQIEQAQLRNEQQQKVTDQQLQRLIKALERGQNGHGKLPSR